MKIFALIPARYNSSRFPGKLMQSLGNDTVIYATYKATVATHLFDKVIVVTDSKEIYDEITKHGGDVLMSIAEHECGTDRIAEAALMLPEADVVVNVQGDEPFINYVALHKIVAKFKEDANEQISAISLMQTLNDPKYIANPNNVKVVTNKDSEAVLFSRSVIPYQRDQDNKATYFKHIGIYAFRRNILIQFAAIKPGPLELVEKLEGNRFIENKIPLFMIITDQATIGIDTEEDLIAANKLLLNGD